MSKRPLIFVVAISLSLFAINQFFDWQRDRNRENLVADMKKTGELIPTATPIEKSNQTTNQLTTSKIQGEQFFVLENDYLQLVFSNVGGSLSEINLPFLSKSDEQSAVLPIGFDKKIIKESPKNAQFPLYPYYEPGKNTPSKPKEGGYYPLLRRSIEKVNVSPLSPRYYAFNLITQDASLYSPKLYKLRRFEKNVIEFEGNEDGVQIVKTYKLPEYSHRVPYCFELSIHQSSGIKPFALTSGVPEVELISDSFSPSIKCLSRDKNRNKTIQIDLPKESVSIENKVSSWVSNANGFFGIIINPTNTEMSHFSTVRIPGNTAPTRLTMIDSLYDLYPAEKYPGYETRLPLSQNSQNLHYRIFAGPYVKEIFETVDAAYYNEQTGSGPAFTSAISFHGWFAFISEPFAKFLLFLMKLFFFVTHSWGISIILLTIALRIMLYPLNTWSIRSTMKMQEIGPQVQAIQARYKKDPKRAQIEIMHLYRSKGVNPFSGCLPLLIQLPFLIGMFDLLKSTFELRGVGFIPGWITNLTAPDVLFSWNYPLFFIGNEFHLLPILLGAVMYIQQRYSAQMNQAKNVPLTDQQRQQKFMGNIMTVVFAFMFYHFPSGLNIYWLSSMLLGILQQWFMMRNKGSHPKIQVLK